MTLKFEERNAHSIFCVFCLNLLSISFVLKDIGVCLKDLSDLFASPFVAE